MRSEIWLPLSNSILREGVSNPQVLRRVSRHTLETVVKLLKESTIPTEIMIIIPSVSLGNVPQLALDLLIHTYGFEPVKVLSDESLCPFIGPMDYSSSSKPSKGIATACQLFKLGDSYIVQVRSPPLLGHKAQFVRQLKSELTEHLSNEQYIAIGSALAGVSDSGSLSSITETQSATSLPDSGYLPELLKQFGESMTALVSWVHEGDNSIDAINMARAIIQKLGWEQPENLVQPVSWSKLYGSSVPLGIENGLYT